MTPAPFCAGVAEVEITPPMGVELCGYGPYLKRTCDQVLDPLYARALWMQFPEAEAVIIAVDICTVSREIRDAAAALLKERFGLDSGHVMVAASHTHSGPSGQEMIGWGERDAEYLARLPGLLAEAAGRARAAAVPAGAGACRMRINGIGRNREQPQIGPVDPAAQLLAVTRTDGSLLALLYNYGAHGVTRYPFSSRISADWPGLVAARVKAETGAMALFLQGACANVNAHEITFSIEHPDAEQVACDLRTEETARLFCDQALPALSIIRPSPTPLFRAAWKELELPCVPMERPALEQIIARRKAGADRMTLAQLRPFAQRLTSETEEEKAWREDRFAVDSAMRQIELMSRPPYVRKAPVQLLRIGESVLVGWPCEAFVELGIELRQRSPYPLTFLSSFANDTAGYMPTVASFESKGQGNEYGYYPREFTPLVYAHLPYRADVSRILVEETLQMIRAL